MVRAPFDRQIYTLEQPMAARKNEATVLLFSGGLDSYILNKLIKPDICLYVGLGHRYQEKEFEALSRIKQDDPELPLVIDERLSLANVEEPSGYIPLRNLLLISIASYYGGIVALGAIKGDSNRDKSESFRQQSQKLLADLHKDTSSKESRSVRIIYPGMRYKKSALVKEYLKRGFLASSLDNTVSCYHPTEWRCGKCMSCFRRWVAMSLNNIHEEYGSPPHEHYREHLQRKKFSLRDFIVAFPNNYDAYKMIKRKGRE